MGRYHLAAGRMGLKVFARESAADRLAAGGGVAAEGEDIEVLEPTLDAALAMVASGEVADGKTIILLQYAKLHRLVG